MDAIFDEKNDPVTWFWVLLLPLKGARDRGGNKPDRFKAHYVKNSRGTAHSADTIMKLYLSTLILVGFVALIRQAGGEALRGAAQERSLVENGQFVNFTPVHFDGCIQARGKAESSDVFLGTGDPFCTQLSVDNDGLIRASGGDLCLQAGHGEVLQDGSKMRLYPCDKRNEFQRFSWTGADGRLKLRSLRYDDLCSTFRGDKPDLGVDPIIFKKCHSVPSTHIKWKETTSEKTVTF